MSHTPPRYVLPEDAVFFRQATVTACARAKVVAEGERDSIADAVLWIARSGYARLSDGTIDPDALAEAALLQFWRINGQLTPPGVTARFAADGAAI